MAITIPTAADMKLMVEVPSDVTDATLEMYISDAGLIVTENLADKGLSEARLSAIYRYLAAHFTLMTTERGGLILSRTGDQSQEQYGGSTVFKEGLTMTRFGNQAIALDTSGTLRAMAAATAVGSGSQLPAQFRVV